MLNSISDVIGHVTIRLAIGHYLLMGPLEVGTKPVCLTVSEIFSGECDAIVHVTLNDL